MTSGNDLASNGELEIVGHAEAQKPSPMLDVAAPISIDPFPFFQLPREIRDLIYYFALLRSDSKLTIKPENFYCYSESDVWPHKDPAPVWDRGRPARLFRVNRQFSAEASKVFYARFPVQFKHTIPAPPIDFAFPDNMSFRNRRYVKSVGFTIMVMISSSPISFSEEEKVRQDFEDALNWLPYIRRVDLVFEMCGDYPQDLRIKDIVDRLVQILSSLRDVAELTLHRGSSVRTSQQKRILEEMRKALARCGQVKLCPRSDCNLTGSRLPILE